MTFAQETELINRAAAALRREGLNPTPERLDAVLNAANCDTPKKVVTVEEAVAGVNALVERAKKVLARPKQVVREYLESSGEVVTNVRVIGERQYLEPVDPYRSENTDTNDEAALKKERDQLHEQLASITGIGERLRVEARLTEIARLLSDIQLQKRVGRQRTQ